MRIKQSIIVIAALTLAAVGLEARDNPRLRTSENLRSRFSSPRPPSEAKETPIGEFVTQSTCEKPEGKFPWNFERAKIVDIVDQISRITCKNFIVSSGIKANQEISIISRTAISADEAWQAFLAALEANNLAIVPSGDFNKIVQRHDASTQAVPFYDDRSRLPNDETLVTFLYEVQNTSRDTIRSLLKGLVGKEGVIDVVGEGIIVVTDSASNIRRIMRILDKIDVAGGHNRIHTIDLEYADAIEVEKKLNEIFEPSGDKKKQQKSALERAAAFRRGSTGSEESDNSGFTVHKIIADERTNKLLVIASDKAFEKIEEVISMIDVPSTDGSAQGQVHVYYLKNSDATKIAKTLNTLTQGSRKSNRRKKDDDNENLFEDEVRVTADEATNSLVVVAGPRDYKSLRSVVDKLDRKRPQVYIEAVIMDIEVNNKLGLGLESFGGLNTPGGLLMGGTPGGGDLLKGLAGGMTNPASIGGAISPFLNSLGLIGAPMNTDGLGLPANVAVPSFGVALKMLQTYSDIDVLATPSLMTLDNEKAEMSVGKKIPILKGTSAVQGLEIPIQQVTYEDASLKFIITPHIGDGDTLRIEIEQDIKEVGENIKINNQDQPVLKTKFTKTTVATSDQQTIVISGLISRERKRSESKWPILGDIPLLGWLFKGRDTEKVDKNLVLVVTPYIIRSDEDFQKIYDRKMREREQLAKMYFGDKISTYDPHIDYTKKRGPLTQLVDHVDDEMQRAENGGPGLPGETVIRSTSAPSGPAPDESEPAEKASEKPAEDKIELPTEDPLPENALEQKIGANMLEEMLNEAYDATSKAANNDQAPAVAS